MQINSKKFVLFNAVLLITLSQLNNNAYTLSFPILTNSFSTSFVMIKFSYTVSIFFFGCFQLIYGPLSDKYGRKTVIITGLTLFLMATLWVFFAKTLYSFLVGRALQGIGLGCAPLASAMMRDVVSGKELNKMFSYISLAIFITPVLGPLIGSYLLYYLSWKAIFGFLFIYASFIYFLIVFKLKETNQYLNKDNFSIKELLKKYSLVFENKEFKLYLLMLVFLYSGEILYILQLPILSQVCLRISCISNGWLMIYTATGMFMGSFLSAHLLEKFSLNRILNLGILFIISASLIMFVFAIFGIFNLYVLVLPMAVYMFGSGMLFPNCIAGCLQAFNNMHGVASALMSGSLMICSAGFSLFGVYLSTNNQLSLSICLLFLTTMLLVIYSQILKVKSFNEYHQGSEI